jgi:hypothetical protein
MPAFTVGSSSRIYIKAFDHQRIEVKLDVGSGDCRGHVFPIDGVDVPRSPFQFALVSPAFTKDPGVWLLCCRRRSRRGACYT